MYRNLERLICLAVFNALASAAVAEPASDLQMANETIGRRAAIIESQTNILRRDAAEHADEVRVAEVFFLPGQSTAALGALASEFELEVIDIHVKAPLGDKGQVQSIGPGLANLLMVDGSFEVRANHAIDESRCFFRKLARFGTAEESAAYSKMAEGPFLIFAANVFGRNESLAALTRIDSVRAVIRHSTNGLKQSWEYHRNEDPRLLRAIPSDCDD